jgi:hypothetical protein
MSAIQQLIPAKPSVADKLASAAKQTLASGGSTMIVVYISYAIFTALFITSIVRMSQFLGSSDSWNQIKSQVTEVLVYSFVGILAFTIASLTLVIQMPTTLSYLPMLVACLALGIGFAAICLATISR